MHMHSSHTALDGGRGTLMRRDRFEVNQYVRVRVTETRFAIGIVTAIDEDRDKATVETRNGYEVTVPMSALRRAFLVVLDLNGVLVVRGRGSFILRPHVSEFLKFVFSNFVVAVWTSGLQRSSDPIIEHVFGSYRDLLLFTLFRDACVSKATVENPYGTEKNLQTIFDRYPLSFHAVNTIIIDDSPDKCSHPDIALCPIPFKDPVTQSQDEGLVETMETLREVLLLDSGVPLIHAAEARLRRMAEGEGEGEEAVAHDAAAVVQPEAHTPPSAAAPPAEPSPATAAEAPPTTEEVELWKTRLCCDHLQGRCKQGDRCPFSHDPDDGRPCSRKSNCRVHGARWPKTREEAEKEARKRQLREAKQMQYKLEQERRQLELQQQPLQQHGGRGQQRRQSDILHQLQESTAQRQRGERPRQPQRRGRHHEVWALGPDVEEDDWASATTGLSHTGDPAYDNMINEQQRQLRQQQQQQRGNAAGERAATNSTAAAAHFHVEEQQLHRREERGRSGASSLNVTTTAAGLSGPTSDLSSGYRRQLQHHSQAFHSTTGSHDAYPHSYMQSTSGQSSNVTDSLAFLFPSATTTTSTAAVIEPFSTRPIAASPPAPQAAPAFHFPASQAPMMTAAHAPNRTFATTAPQPLSQQPQAIRISGSQGDSSAVVNQLQALLRGS